jgi:hypothetical protein
MQRDKLVKLIALWDFAGPEGSPARSGRGVVKQGTMFQTTKERARTLISTGKARRVIPAPEQKRPGPERTQDERPTQLKEDDSFVYTDLNIQEVLAKIEDGILTPAQVKELEQSRPDGARLTLMVALNKMLEG